ncbi:hypothetical protein XSR1_10006 [Xenorhabdus szentirmaii DSM 16338]|uniref:Uncharacterized protein n=1 Tax=Xenorhabdus szentirmaii DSM 16338 TaxID=1427518 RepID=W1IRR8_9GAMM|nr:hypothetical protein XSR1_10006 [Xenorhabdus szentirmaii DSM 16338]
MLACNDKGFLYKLIHWVSLVYVLHEPCVISISLFLKYYFFYLLKDTFEKVR